MMRHVWYAFRYSSPLPVRVMLAIAALLWAILLAVDPARLAVEAPYDILFRIAPRWIWAVLFAVDGLLLTWRIVDARNLVGVTRIVNAATCGLWSLYICATAGSQHYLPPDAADEIAILLAAAWATLRTDLTQSDKETA